MPLTAFRVDIDTEPVVVGLRFLLAVLAALRGSSSGSGRLRGSEPDPQQLIFSRQQQIAALAFLAFQAAGHAMGRSLVPGAEDYPAQLAQLAEKEAIEVNWCQEWISSQVPQPPAGFGVV